MATRRRSWRHDTRKGGRVSHSARAAVRRCVTFVVGLGASAGLFVVLVGCSNSVDVGGADGGASGASSGGQGAHSSGGGAASGAAGTAGRSDGTRGGSSSGERGSA